MLVQVLLYRRKYGNDNLLMFNHKQVLLCSTSSIKFRVASVPQALQWATSAMSSQPGNFYPILSQGEAYTKALLRINLDYICPTLCDAGITKQNR